VKRWLALAPIALVGSCKFAGPSANPDEYVASDAGEDATVDVGQGGQGDDAPVASDDSSGGPGADDASDTGTADDGGGAPCTATAPDAGCDPVHNTGCITAQQCDVSVSLTGTPTGACVWSTGTDAGGPCSTLFGESCSPGHTCVNSTCRTLCYCDSDCPAGKSCSDKTGAQGFTLCAP
jgi:hypothetical protein